MKGKKKRDEGGFYTFSVDVRPASWSLTRPLCVRRLVLLASGLEKGWVWREWLVERRREMAEVISISTGSQINLAGVLGTNELERKSISCH